MTEYKAILTKMAAVMKDVQYIQKDAYNKFGNYNYASERAIKEQVGAALREHGIIFQMNQGQPTVIQSQYEDKDGNSRLASVLHVPCEYHFWDVESGECLSGTFNGAGHARDDKGLYAATTGAIKYILTSIFMITTGDDPETDINSKPVKTKKTSTTKPAQPKQKQQVSTEEQTDDEDYIIESKYGTMDKPNYCHKCEEKHIMVGDKIHKRNEKWVAVVCPSDGATDDKEPPADESQMGS